MMRQRTLLRIYGEIMFLCVLLLPIEVFARFIDPTYSASPIATVGQMQELPTVLGEDPTMIPPLAWRCVRGTSGAFSLKQKFQTAGLVVMDWGDGLIQAFQVGAGTSETFTHTYSGSGPFTVEVFACAADLTFIDAQVQDIRAVGLGNLTNLTYVSFRSNKIRGLVDLANCFDLENVDLASNQDVNISGNMTFRIGDVKNVKAYRATLDSIIDMSAASSLVNFEIWENSVDEVKLPTVGNSLNTLRLEVNELNQILDLTPYASLTYVEADRNQIQEVKVSGLTNLIKFNLRNNQIGKLIDLSSCFDLEIVDLAYNTNASDNMTLRIGNVENLTAYFAQLDSTINLSQANSMYYCNIRSNQIDSLILPSNGDTLITLFAYANTLNQSLDLSYFSNLATIDFTTNLLTQVSMPNFSSSLTTIKFQNNHITDIDGIGSKVYSYGISGFLTLHGLNNGVLDPTIKANLISQGWTVNSN